MYVIAGAAGHIGRIIANELLSKGKKVRVLGRDPGKLKEFTTKGAEAMTGDLNDASYVDRAFEGGTAAFCLLPPNPMSLNFRAEQQRIAKNFIEAVRMNKISHVVLLSSIGAHLRNGAGVIDGLGDMEEYFLELKDVNVLNLRPSYFMENILFQVQMIKMAGMMGSALRGDLVFPVVASKDIGERAAKRLLDLSFKGNTIEYVLGPRDVTFNEIASVFGKAIGIPDLKYVQFSFDEAKNGLVKSGYISENVAEVMTRMAEGFNNGNALNAHHRTSENTTHTTLEEFSKVFAAAYGQGV